MKASYAGSGCYQIAVQGRVPTVWRGRLGSMRVGESENDVTVLSGDVHDQTELAAILNTLYELRLPLLSLDRLGSGDSSDRGARGETEGQ